MLARGLQYCGSAPSSFPGTPLLQALVDAPGQARRVVNFKRLALTDLKIDIPRLAAKKVVVAKFAEAGETLTLVCINSK